LASTKNAAAIDIINHAHHRREPNALLDLLADDAELVHYDMDSLGQPRTFSGKEEISATMVEIFSRDMIHEVREVVAGDDRIAYMVHCEYPDGRRVVASYVVDLKDGKITRMVGQQSWDE
jgi:ketosteroid isomerase-like protein